MEDDQNGRRPKWKTTKMEDDQNERRPTWKTTKIEDLHHGKWSKWKMTKMKDDLSVSNILWDTKMLYLSSTLPSQWRKPTKKLLNCVENGHFGKNGPFMKP